MKCYKVIIIFQLALERLILLALLTLLERLMLLIFLTVFLEVILSFICFVDFRFHS